MARAVVLLSGGLDSATVAAMAIADGFEVSALSIRYGQRHEVELAAAHRVAESLGIGDHRVVSIDLTAFGASALTDAAIDVPKDRLGEPGIPTTYVPARNTIFLALALGHAEAIGAYDVFFGANALDYSGYPDCRPAFRAAFETLANCATRAADDADVSYRIHAPLMDLTKAEIIRRGTELGIDYAQTHSCYDPAAEIACGHCDSCLLRKKGFEVAEIADPTRYE